MPSAQSVPAERLALLDRAWTAAAQLYLEELVPRFMPWFQSAVQMLLPHQLPPGPVLVPCCGPGHELVLLHDLFGGTRPVVGVDLSTGMIELAKEAIAKYQEQQQAKGARPEGTAPSRPCAAGGAAGAGGAALEAHVGDASSLDEHAPAAAVVSVFGLQQMGAVAPQALASWGRCLAPGGVAVVVLWPSRVEREGPWSAFDQVVLEKAAADSGKPPPAPDAAQRSPPGEWETRLTEAVAQEPGLEVLVDTALVHEIRWPSLEHFWKVMTYGGPWRARRLAQGDAAMDDLWARMAAKYGGKCTTPLAQHPQARLVVLRKSRSGGDVSGAGDGAGSESGSASVVAHSAL